MSLSGLDFNRLNPTAQADPLEGVQVNQDISQGIVIGDGSSVTEFWSLNAERHRLTVNSLGGGALSVNSFVFLAVPIQLITQARAGTGG